MLIVADEFKNPNAGVAIGNPAPVVDLVDTEHRGRIWLPFVPTTAACS